VASKNIFFKLRPKSFKTLCKRVTIKTLVLSWRHEFCFDLDYNYAHTPVSIGFIRAYPSIQENAVSVPSEQNKHVYGVSLHEVPRAI